MQPVNFNVLSKYHRNQDNYFNHHRTLHILSYTYVNTGRNHEVYALYFKLSYYLLCSWMVSSTHHSFNYNKLSDDTQIDISSPLSLSRLMYPIIFIIPTIYFLATSLKVVEGLFKGTTTSLFKQKIQGLKKLCVIHTDYKEREGRQERRKEKIFGG